jgi:hypothetical protein
VTIAELRAARAFRFAQRGELSAKNAEHPPDLTVSVFVRQVRHACTARGGSVNLELREHYVTSPEWGILDSVAVERAQAGVPAPASGMTVVPAGRFGFIFTEGHCPACGMTARSSSGRLVDPQERPPAAHAVHN